MSKKAAQTVRSYKTIARTVAQVLHELQGIVLAVSSSHQAEFCHGSDIFVQSALLLFSFVQFWLKSWSKMSHLEKSRRNGDGEREKNWTLIRKKKWPAAYARIIHFPADSLQGLRSKAEISWKLALL